MSLMLGEILGFFFSVVTFPEVIGDALDEPAKRGGKGERKSEVALHTCFPF